MTEIAQIAPESTPDTSPASATRWIRDLWTNELKEVPAGSGGRQIIARGKLPAGYSDSYRLADPWAGKDHVCNAISLKPEDATPERIAQENENARRHGTGAWWDKDGNCHTPTRGSLNRELIRKSEENQATGARSNFVNFDGGYGDFTGRSR